MEGLGVALSSFVVPRKRPFTGDRVRVPFRWPRRSSTEMTCRALDFLSPFALFGEYKDSDSNGEEKAGRELRAEGRTVSSPEKDVKSEFVSTTKVLLSWDAEVGAVEEKKCAPGEPEPETCPGRRWFGGYGIGGAKIRWSGET